MPDAAVIVGEQGCGGGMHDGGFAVGSGESGDGLEGFPGGGNQNLDFSRYGGGASENLRGYEAANGAELWQHILREIVRVSGRELRGGAGRPEARDHVTTPSPPPK